MYFTLYVRTVPNPVSTFALATRTHTEWKPRHRPTHSKNALMQWKPIAQSANTRCHAIHVVYVHTLIYLRTAPNSPGTRDTHTHGAETPTPSAPTRTPPQSNPTPALLTYTIRYVKQWMPCTPCNAMLTQPSTTDTATQYHACDAMLREPGPDTVGNANEGIIQGSVWQGI